MNTIPSLIKWAARGYLRLVTWYLVVFFGIAFLKGMSLAHGTECEGEIVEPVSVCRAESACGKRNAVRLFGALLSGMGQASSGGRNQAMDQYKLCVDRNLDAQRANLQYKLSMRALDQAK